MCKITCASCSTFWTPREIILDTSHPLMSKMKPPVCAPAFFSDCQRTRRQDTLRHHKENLSTFDRQRTGAPGTTRCVITGAYSANASAPGPRKQRRFQNKEQGLVIFEPGTPRCVYTGAYSAYRVGPWPPKITPRRHSACYARSTVLCHVRDSRAPAREYGVLAANSSFCDGVSRSETEFAAQSRTGPRPGAVQRANTAGRTKCEIPRSRSRSR